MGLAIGYLIAPRSDKSYKKELERQRDEIILHIQQTEILKKEITAHDSLWTKYVQKQKDSLATERKTTTRLHYENKRLKNRPVPNWSSHDLDSIIGSIVR